MTFLAHLKLHQAVLLKLAVVVGVFLALTFIFLAVTRIVLRWIGRLTGSHREWMQALVQALSPALKVGAVAVALNVEEIPTRWHGLIGAIVSAGAVLALVVFADGLLQFWMGRASVRFPL